MRKGIFIEGITAEMFKNGSLEAVEALISEGECEDIELPEWIPTREKLPENKSYVLTTIKVPGRQAHARSGWYEDGLFMNDNADTWKETDKCVKAWMPLPKPYREMEE